MLVSLIAALAEGRILGSARGGIPWDHPRDRAHFRAATTGKWVLVGRRTYEEMEGWFGDRTPVVLSRDPGFRPRWPAHRCAPSMAAALDLVAANGAGELIVCGGARVYAAALPFADRLLLTRLALTVAVDDPLRFPDFDSAGRWRLVHAEAWPEAGGVPAARFEIHVCDRNSPLARAAGPV